MSTEPLAVLLTPLGASRHGGAIASDELEPFPVVTEIGEGALIIDVFIDMTREGHLLDVTQPSELRQPHPLERRPVVLPPDWGALEAFPRAPMGMNVPSPWTPLGVLHARNAAWRVVFGCVSWRDDEGRIRTTWRAEIPRADLVWPLRSFALTIENAASPRPLRVIAGDMPRGRYDAACTRREWHEGVRPVLSEARLVLLETQLLTLAPFPLLTPEARRHVERDLARSEDRAAVLERHGLSEHNWFLERRALT